MIPYTTVIVTYSNRGHLLSSVVSSTVSSGCDHVIIIDNGSDVESKKLINELPALYNLVKFTVSTNDRNEGSAIAFSHGMDWHPIQKMNSFYSLMMIIFLKKGLFSVQ
ncbi:glycosyltransferase [Klebsiella pneumoniae]